jgi:hypothetical protein
MTLTPLQPDEKPDDIPVILGDLDIVLSLIKVTRNSLSEQEIAADEIATLDIVIVHLTDIHQRIDLSCSKGDEGHEKPTED